MRLETIVSSTNFCSMRENNAMEAGNPKSERVMPGRTNNIKKLQIATRKQIRDCTHERDIVKSVSGAFTEGMCSRIQNNHVEVQATVVTSVSLRKSVTM